MHRCSAPNELRGWATKEQYMKLIEGQRWSWKRGPPITIEKTSKEFDPEQETIYNKGWVFGGFGGEMIYREF